MSGKELYNAGILPFIANIRYYYIYSKYYAYIYYS